jgi:hypothetical protein
MNERHHDFTDVLDGFALTRKMYARRGHAASTDSFV